MKPKLDNDQRMFALRMYGEGVEVASIRREILQRFGISLQHKALYDTFKAKKHQPYIKAFRDSYLAKVKSVPIANKRVRIDDLEKERIRLRKLINAIPMKTRSDKSLYLSLVAELRRIMDAAREEMEKKPHMFQNVVIGMGDMSDAALHKRKTDLWDKLRSGDGRRTSGAESDPGGTGSED